MKYVILISVHLLNMQLFEPSLIAIPLFYLSAVPKSIAYNLDHRQTIIMGRDSNSIRSKEVTKCVYYDFIQFWSFLFGLISLFRTSITSSSWILIIPILDWNSLCKCKVSMQVHSFYGLDQWINSIFLSHRSRLWEIIIHHDHSRSPPITLFGPWQWMEEEKSESPSNNSNGMTFI